MLSHIILFSKFCNCHNSIINKCFQSAIASWVIHCLPLLPVGPGSEDEVGDHHHSDETCQHTPNYYRDCVVRVTWKHSTSAHIMLNRIQPIQCWTEYNQYNTNTNAIVNSWSWLQPVTISLLGSVVAVWSLSALPSSDAEWSPRWSWNWVLAMSTSLLVISLGTKGEIFSELHVPRTRARVRHFNIILPFN